jgi:hypothetical protein
MLDKERDFLHNNKDRLLKEYGGKFLVIKGEEVGGAYDTMEDALQGSVLAYGLENVLIRRPSDADLEVSIPALTLGLISANFPDPNRRPSENS